MSLTVASRIKYALKVGGWLLLFLAGTELFMRVFIVSVFPYSVLNKGNVFEIWGIEGYGMVRYLPNAEVRTPYDSGDTSVVALGNSFTLAKQVMDWQNYTSVAEVDLRERGISADLHNLGLNGLTLPSYIARSAFILERYKPDVVVIQVAPSEFFSEGFQRFMRGGHFEYNAAGKLELARATTPNLFLPEQLGENAPPVDLWNYTSISTYLSYTRRNEAEGKRPEVDLGRYSDEEIASAELKLVADAYGEVPIVFLIIPRRVSRYEDEGRYQLIINLIARDYPNWRVVYPIDQFARLMNSGIAPMGFGNAKPFVGHMNVDGHKAVGDALADMLASMLK